MLRRFRPASCASTLSAMSHRYETRGIVLARTPVGEASSSVTLLTEELGLVHARAQSLRLPGAKLAAALATFAESDFILVRGKEYWRLAGAVLEEEWFSRLQSGSARRRAARIAELLLRLVTGEAQDPKLFMIFSGFLYALAMLPSDAYESAEILAVLRMLAVLGFDAGEIPGEVGDFGPAILAQVLKARASYIMRINIGIAASGL